MLSNWLTNLSLNGVRNCICSRDIKSFGREGKKNTLNFVVTVEVMAAVK